MFILREFLLYISIMVFVWVAGYGILIYFEISSTSLSSLSISAVVGMVSIPSVRFIHTITRLIKLGLDFDREINQSGVLELKFTSLIEIQSLIKAFKKRKNHYFIIEREEKKNEARFLIQDQRNKKDKISIQFLESNDNETQIIINTNVPSIETSFSLLKSNHWHSFAEHLFHFHKIFKDYEVASIRSMAKADNIAYSST